MFKFGKRSRKNLYTCHDDLIIIAEESIKVSPVDFGIREGKRTFKKQLEYFLEGSSTLDPRIPEELKRAMHVKEPVSLAFDIYIYIPGHKELAYDLNNLCLVSGVITSTAQRLYNENKIEHLIRWGGNWDRDQEILIDQSFDDSPHFELYKVPICSQ